MILDKNKLKGRLAERDMTQQDLANATEISLRTIANIVNTGEVKTAKHLPLIARALGLELESLIQSQKINDEETGFFAEGNVGSVRPNLKEYYTQVKMLSARAQMGIPSMTHETFNLTWLEETYPVFMPTIALSNKHLVIEVVGDSMVPEIKDRALVLAEAVNTNDIKYQSGAVFAVLYAGNHFVVKRIKTNELNTNGTLTLWSDNQMYGNITIHGEDIIHMWRIIEKVKEPVR